MCPVCLLCATAGLGDGKSIQLYKQRRMKQNHICLQRSIRIYLSKSIGCPWSKFLLTDHRSWLGGGLWWLQHGNRNACIGALLYYSPTPCKGKELMQNQHVQILFPSALGPRATAQNGINWDYGGFGCLAATQGWMLNLCLSDLVSCLIKLAHSGHCLPRTFLSKEWLQVVLLCDRLLAFIQYVALMDCCNTTFLSQITKSTNKFNGFSSHLSGLFLWYENVNRCDCSRIYRMGVELLLDKRKHLLGKYPPSRDVKIQSTSPPLRNLLLWIKRYPLAGPDITVPQSWLTCGRAPASPCTSSEAV